MYFILFLEKNWDIVVFCCNYTVFAKSFLNKSKEMKSSRAFSHTVCAVVPLEAKWQEWGCCDISCQGLSLIHVASAFGSRFPCGGTDYSTSACCSCFVFKHLKVVYCIINTTLLLFVRSPRGHQQPRLQPAVRHLEHRGHHVHFVSSSQNAQCKVNVF